MQTLKSLLISLLLLIGFSAIGYSIGKSQAEVNNEGKFSTWEKLEGDLKFEQIADATSQIVWAKTVDGALFIWDTNCAREPNCNQWFKVNEIPSDIHEYDEPPIEKGSSCPPSNLKYFTNPPGKLIECVHATSYGADIMPDKSVYYALLDDGKIWVWEFSHSMMDDFIYIIICTCPGIILGVVAFIGFRVYQRRKPMIPLENNK